MLARKAATYEDLLALPEHVVGELIDGELVVSPRPASRHARAAGRLLNALGGPFDEGKDGPGGWIILVEPELHLGRQVLVPDLAGLRRERMPELPDVAFFELAPDWVCEVLSPSTAVLDRTRKLRHYAAAGVKHAWLVEPQLMTIELLRLNDERAWTIVDTHAGTAKVRAEPFDAIELDLALLWAR